MSLLIVKPHLTNTTLSGSYHDVDSPRLAIHALTATTGTYEYMYSHLQNRLAAISAFELNGKQVF